MDLAGRSAFQPDHCLRQKTNHVPGPSRNMLARFGGTVCAFKSWNNLEVNNRSRLFHPSTAFQANAKIDGVKLCVFFEPSRDLDFRCPSYLFPLPFGKLTVCYEKSEFLDIFSI